MQILSRYRPRPPIDILINVIPKVLRPRIRQLFIDEVGGEARHHHIKNPAGQAATEPAGKAATEPAGQAATERLYRTLQPHSVARMAGTEHL